MTTDAWENRKKSERVTAADVRPGDIVAAGGRMHEHWIEPDAFRDVLAVEPEPDGIRIRYTTARGRELSRIYRGAATFYRIAERPELPPVPGPQPERMEDGKYRRLEDEMNMWARFAADAILPGGDGVQKAREYARKYQGKAREYDAENKARSNQVLLDLIEAETTGNRDEQVSK